MTVLITGGAGYIGSHIGAALAKAGRKIVILDNFSTSRPETLKRLERVTGNLVPSIEADIRDTAVVEGALRAHRCEAVVHCAGLKSVRESVANPRLYYDVNVMGTASLLKAMEAAAVPSLVFSSSATVYGEPQGLPLREDHPLAPANPYGHTKRAVEDMLADQVKAHPWFAAALLRYFNPVGAHDSGQLGEDPADEPQNLMPCVAQVATGQRPYLAIYGDDYPTPDGTAVRDYIHVMDVAEGHIAALDYLERQRGLLIANLGTGRGHSVREVVSAFEQASGHPIPVHIEPRRPGDIAAYWADPTCAAATLGWEAMRSLDTMCADAWRWVRGKGEESGESEAE